MPNHDILDDASKIAIADSILDWLASHRLIGCNDEHTRYFCDLEQINETGESADAICQALKCGFEHTGTIKFDWE